MGKILRFLSVVSIKSSSTCQCHLQHIPCKDRYQHAGWFLSVSTAMSTPPAWTAAGCSRYAALLPDKHRLQLSHYYCDGIYRAGLVLKGSLPETVIKATVQEFPTEDCFLLLCWSSEPWWLPRGPLAKFSPASVTCADRKSYSKLTSSNGFSCSLALAFSETLSASSFTSCYSTRDWFSFGESNLSFF